MVTTATADIPQNQSPILTGTVLGGRQPVAGSTVTLWAAGNTGYGSPSTQLATTISASDGTFNFGTSSGNTYSCPSSVSTTASQLVYITASGGMPTTGITNSSATFMVGLGDCLTAKTNNPSVNINEVTTIASMFAMAQFFQPSASGLGSFGTTPKNLQGLANAMITIKTIVALSNGSAFASNINSAAVNNYATTPNITVTPEQSKLNSLADILAACVNTTGSSSTACSTLFNDVYSTPVKDTLQAAYYLAVNPTSTVNGASNIPALFGLVTPQSPFLPTIAASPSDWTLAVTYSSNSSQSINGTPVYFLDKPGHLGIDSLGNVWIANIGSALSGAAGNSVSELNPGGMPLAQVLTGPGQLINPRNLIIDPNNNLYVGSYGVNGTGAQLSEFTAIGQTNTFPLGSIGPEALASDGAGNIYIANYGGADGSGDLEILPAHSSSGTTALQLRSGVSAGDFSTLALDSYNDLWLSNSSSTATTQFICSAVPCTATTTTAGGQTGPRAIAVDHVNGIWIGNSNGSNPGSMSELTPTTTTTITAAPNSPFFGGGLKNPTRSVFGGLGNLWVTNYAANSGSLSELTPSGAPVGPSNGFIHHFAGAEGIAIDGSGNVWVGNLDAAAPNGFITEIIGAAGPAITPYSANLPAVAAGVNTIGNRP